MQGLAATLLSTTQPGHADQAQDRAKDHRRFRQNVATVHHVVNAENTFCGAENDGDLIRTVGVLYEHVAPLPRAVGIAEV